MNSIAQPRPETFRLPKPGVNDPYFGITRGGYYQGEVEGWWTLIRLKRPGLKRGTTLVPYDQVAAFIAKQGKAQPVANGGGQHYARSPKYYEQQQQKKEQQKVHPKLGTLS